MSVEIRELGNRWVHSMLHDSELDSYIEYLSQPLDTDFNKLTKYASEDENGGLEFVVEYIEDTNINHPMPITVDIRISTALNKQPYYVFKLGKDVRYTLTEVPWDFYTRLLAARKLYSEWMGVLSKLSDLQKESDTLKWQWREKQRELTKYICEVSK